MAYEHYPKWKYKEGEAPRLLQTHQDEAELGDSWFDRPDMTNYQYNQEEAASSATPPGYVPTEFPKWKYAPEHPGGRLIHNSDEEDALPSDVTWYDKPDFTQYGEDSTDTTSMVSIASPSRPPFNAIGGPNVLAPVPEMKQGVAKTKASSIDTMDEDADSEDDDEADTGADDSDDSVLGEAAGEANNNFDQANGVNPGDAAPEGKNPNGATGKVTKTETEKQTAEETKKIAVKKKGKSADDLL